VCFANVSQLNVLTRYENSLLYIAALVFYGFYTSLGGRPVFGGAVLED
jgi:hypothetical protein